MDLFEMEKYKKVPESPKGEKATPIVNMQKF